MKPLKKLLCLFAIFTMITPVAALADEYIEYTFPQDDAQTEISLFAADSKNSSALSEEEKGLALELAEALKNQESVLSDINDRYQILCTQENVGRIFSGLVKLVQYEYPEIFYFTTPDSLSIEYSSADGCITNIGLDGFYSMSADEIAEHQSAIDEETDKILALVNDTISDTEKVLIVHDYIVSNYEYDTSLQIRTLDEMIMQKKGVCQGYSYLFKYVLNSMGIECVTVPSTACAHMWNKVMLDGEWFNVDLNFDDALPNRSTNISHNYFLLNDEEIEDIDKLYSPTNRSHRTWDRYKWDGDTEVEESDSETYSYSVLHDIEGAVALKGENIYCIDKINNICLLIYDENVLRPVYTLSAAYVWRPYGVSNREYEKSFSALAVYDGEIYFNSPDKVFRLKADHTEQEVYSYDGDDVSQTYFYGLYASENGLYAEYSTNPALGTEEAIEIPVTQEPDEPIDPTPEPQPTPDTNHEIEMPCTSEITPQEDGSVEISVEVPVEEEFVPEENDMVYVAEYKDGVLVSVTQMSLKEVQEKQSVNYSVEDENSTELKVLVWSESLSPLAALASFNLSY